MYDLVKNGAVAASFRRLPRVMAYAVPVGGSTPELVSIQTYRSDLSAWEPSPEYFPLRSMEGSGVDLTQYGIYRRRRIYPALAGPWERHGSFSPVVVEPDGSTSETATIVDATVDQQKRAVVQTAKAKALALLQTGDPETTLFDAVTLLLRLVKAKYQYPNATLQQAVDNLSARERNSYQTLSDLETKRSDIMDHAVALIAEIDAGPPYNYDLTAAWPHDPVEGPPV